jgi:hypothetical protein
VLKTTDTAEAKAAEARTLRSLIFPPRSHTVKASIEKDVKLMLPSPYFRRTRKQERVTNENDNFMLKKK